MSYAKVLEDLGRLIEAEVESFLKLAVDEGDAYHPFIGHGYKLVKEFVLRRGRRLASCSTLMTYKGYKGEIDERIVKAASAIELYRHCILIHDDIVDRDDMRRGGKTVHKALEEGYDERFGVGSAIFLGNTLYSLSLQAILLSGFETGKLNQVLKLMVSGFREVNESQMLDLLFEYMFPDRREWFVMASKRASSLFKVAMLVGAILADAPKSELRLLSEAASCIGYAFDIQDDIIDTFATEEQYGRKPCGDLIKGKKPLHLIIAMENDESAKKLLMEARKEHGKIMELRRLIKDRGGLEGAKQVSKRCAEKAIASLRRSGMNKEVKEFFTSFIEYITESLEWYR